MDLLAITSTVLCVALAGTVGYLAHVMAKIIKDQSAVILSERLSRDDDTARRIVSSGLAENMADRQVRDEDEGPPADDSDEGWTSVGP